MKISRIVSVGLSWKAHSLGTLVVFVTLFVLSAQSVRAQTDDRVAKFLAGNLVDSAITETNGNVGIGTVDPQAKAHVSGTSWFTGDTTPLPAAAGTGVAVGFGSAGYMFAFDYGSFTPRDLLLNNPGGNVGIGTASPAKKLDVQGGSMRVSGKLGTRGFDPDVGYPDGIDGGLHTWDVYAEGLVGVGQNGSLNAYMRNDGEAAFKVVRITGADFSEKFKVRDTQTKVEPGMVVAIDPANAGKLLVSRKAYDRRVVGILSGAGGITTGMLMGQPGTLADGDHAVALTGRVYVWADASTGPIAPGDLLTTSNVAGHAMKVSDHRKAQGATIGKAMTGLSHGRGLVLTLVTLQ